MCGIAGIIGNDADALRTALSAMVAAQLHRGPDDAGEILLPFGRRALGLGQRRLSIIDLSPAGHQPMVHPRTGDQIVFNGEIYNFPELRRDLISAGEEFRGRGDTEVLLHGLSRWGTEFLKRLEGMFAFAYFNAQDQSLTLARDPMGIKPLYVWHQGGALLFASEVRAILASGRVERRVNMQGLAGLLAYGAVQSPSTIVQGIECFPAGAYQVFRADEAVPAPPVRYWSRPGVRQMDEGSAVEALRTAVDASVRAHLVADVPVGVFLSSGLDSTVIAGLASRHHQNLRSFTVGFSDQPDLNEQPLASRTAKEFGLRHTDITITNDDASAAASAWLSSLDQPSMDGLNVYVISKAVRAQGITVALSGQGGDELFGGYPSFRDVPRLRRNLSRLRWLPPALRATLAGLATAGRSLAFREKLRDMARSDGSLRELWFHRRRAMSTSQLSALGIEAGKLGLSTCFQRPESLEGFESNPADAVAAISALESTFYQQNQLLRDSDTNGMAHSLEIRVPLLDRRILDLAFAMPGTLRLPDGKPAKHLMRLAFPTLLRTELLWQKKMGFSLPIRRWMLGPLRDSCAEALSHLESSEILERAAVAEIWSAFQSDPESQIWSRAFTLVVLGTYLKRMNLA